ncbi:hypothetical protein RGQ13_06050 [Thalassotalea psychrophila]|uniref:Outer membrane protein beta-barrel domain-containing protein n=1 Tax=Thalassotalea psychrophila TaxID=3065647 RepID=A0ABY9TYB2_9GAMM|nr:hypothetical protein RGQ13_06050 [Colwelliaceae bacterium SQ149]
MKYLIIVLMLFSLTANAYITEPVYDVITDFKSTDDYDKGAFIGFSEGNNNEKAYTIGFSVRDDNFITKFSIMVIDEELSESAEWDFTFDYYFMPDRFFTPYIGAGVGARYFQDCYHYPSEHSLEYDCDENNSVLSVFPEAGVSLKLHNNFTLAVNYRYHYHAFSSIQDFSAIGLNVLTYF